jgi:hypothetical protein
MRFSKLRIRLRFACAKRQCEHVASPPCLLSVLPGCHLQSIWYRLYRKTVVALDCRMSPATSRLMLESSGVVLELRRCSLWVRNRHFIEFDRRPLYPQKQTLELSRVMSALCQKRTYAVQQKGGLLDHLVGAQQNRLRHREAKPFCRVDVDSHVEFDR